MTKTILITGIAGLLGSHSADRFLAEGYKVIGVDNFVGGYRENVPQNVELHVADCCDFYEMLEIMKSTKPDVVLHAACTAYEGLSVFSPSLVFDNTASATVSVASAAVAVGVKRFIQCSSMARYGNQGGNGQFTEDMIPQPQDPYGIAKVAAEEVLLNLSKVHGMEVVILVPHNIIGSRQRYDDPFRNVAAIMINRMLKGLQPVIYGDGQQTRSFSFVGDVVNPIWIASHSTEVVGEVINVGPDGNAITILELAHKIGAILDFEVNPLYMPDRPQEVKHATCSANKARKLLSYNAQIDVDTGLSEMIRYIQSHGTKDFTYDHRIEILNNKTPRTWIDKII
jgi:UDP-glucose 4-epimerase